MIKCKIQSIFLSLYYVLYQQFSYFLTPANFKVCNQSSSSETLQDYFIQVHIILVNAFEKIVKKKYIIQHCAVTLLTKKTTLALYLICATFFYRTFSCSDIFSLEVVSQYVHAMRVSIVGQVKIRKKTYPEILSLAQQQDNLG